MLTFKQQALGLALFYASICGAEWHWFETHPPTPQQVAKWEAQAQHVDPHFVAAIIDNESGWNPNAVSPAGAVGIMQQTPENAIDNGIKPEDRTKPDKSIKAGVRFIKKLFKRFKDPAKVAAAYNCGPYCRNWNNSETAVYVPRVMASYQKRKSEGA
jgi:soluble lytic murein transglycosylase-like protein